MAAINPKDIPEKIRYRIETAWDEMLKDQRQAREKKAELASTAEPTPSSALSKETPDAKAPSSSIPRASEALNTPRKAANIAELILTSIGKYSDMVHNNLNTSMVWPSGRPMSASSRAALPSCSASRSASKAMARTAMFKASDLRLSGGRGAKKKKKKEGLCSNVLTFYQPNFAGTTSAWSPSRVLPSPQIVLARGQPRFHASSLEF
ncbi:hypothetical protein QBC43DRAFT_348983 [Cladorrhinum sp. PSN259]|nr:hypothetical protein QBC43DRAFT_348983 [Cladorrhinum sp. PSN259]